MIFYAAFACVVLALIRKDNRTAQVKYGLFLFVVMVIGSILFGWFMYLFAS
jgi:hypothetical protein